MSFALLIAIIAGVVWGRSMVEWSPLWRRGLPIATVLLGGVLFRQGAREIGVTALQNGEVSANGLAGLMLILLGLMALLTLVIIFLGGSLGWAQRNSRRRK